MNIKDLLPIDDTDAYLEPKKLEIWRYTDKLDWFKPKVCLLNGYPVVNAVRTSTGKQATVHVHKAVADLLVDNPDPATKTEVHHIDFSKDNYEPSNLVHLTSNEHREAHRQDSPETWAEVVRLYTKEFLSTYQIEKKLDLPYGQAGHILKAEGVKLRSISDGMRIAAGRKPLDHAQVAADRDGGMKWREVCDKHDIPDPGNAHTIVKRYKARLANTNTTDL